jgi:hypothetical protein
VSDGGVRSGKPAAELSSTEGPASTAVWQMFWAIMVLPKPLRPIKIYRGGTAFSVFDSATPANFNEIVALRLTVGLVSAATTLMPLSDSWSRSLARPARRSPQRKPGPDTKGRTNQANLPEGNSDEGRNAFCGSESF